MTVADRVLAVLFVRELTMAELRDRLSEVKPQVLSVTVSRLKKEGRLEQPGGKGTRYRATVLGRPRRYAGRRNDRGDELPGTGFGGLRCQCGLSMRPIAHGRMVKFVCPCDGHWRLANRNDLPARVDAAAKW